MSTDADPNQGLHHFAWRCRDAEQTQQFYEDLLSLPLVHVIRQEHVPSTGQWCPDVHVFFAMRDGSAIAFFNLGDNEAAAPSHDTPAWVNHIALHVQLDAWTGETRGAPSAQLAGALH